MNLPIITLTVEGMKNTVKVALAEQVVLMDAEVKRAVERYCTEENIAQTLKQAVFHEMNLAVKEETQSFFRYSGKGRAAVKEAILEHLEKKMPEPKPKPPAPTQAEIDAWKWGYTYLQDRMKSLGRDGWAHDCDGEIEARIKESKL